MPRTQSTKRSPAPSPASTKNRDAAELFKGGYKLAHGKKCSVKPAAADQPEETETLSTVDQQWHRKIAVRGACAREKLIDALNPDSVGALRDKDVERLGHFLLILQNYEGNGVSPIEHCIISLAQQYADGIASNVGLTPDDIIFEVDGPDGCRTWFDTDVSIARTFRTRYAAALDKAEAEAGERAVQ